MTRKEAMKIAMDYVQDLYSEAGATRYLIEEIETENDGDTWAITVGFDVPIPIRETTASTATGFAHNILRYERKYKKVKLDAATGEVRGMTIREVM